MNRFRHLAGSFLGFVFIFVLAYLAATSRPNQQQQTADQQGQISTPVAVVLQPQAPDSVRAQAEASSEFHNYIKKLIEPTVIVSVVLAVAAFAAIRVALATLKQLKRQTDANILEAQATKIAADTAKKSIDLMISKERARITVDPNGIERLPPIIPGMIDRPWDEKFAINIWNHGPINAQIIRGGLTIKVTDSKDPPHVYPELRASGHESLGLPEFFAHTSEPFVQEILLRTYSYYIDWGAVQDGRKFIHIYGSILYRHAYSDPDGKPCETAFRYIFRPFDCIDSPEGLPMGYWSELGGDKENYQT